MLLKVTSPPASVLVARQPQAPLDAVRPPVYLQAPRLVVLENRVPCNQDGWQLVEISRCDIWPHVFHETIEQWEPILVLPEEGNTAKARPLHELCLDAMVRSLRLVPPHFPASEVLSHACLDTESRTANGTTLCRNCCVAFTYYYMIMSGAVGRPLPCKRSGGATAVHFSMEQMDSMPHGSS